MEAWLKCFYMRDHLGSTFNGTISSVVGFGLFVALDDIYTEGLVHVSELGADYFHFEPAKHLMLGERTGKRYRLGDRVRVKVVRVDMESTKIDFVLMEDAGPLAVKKKELGAGVWGDTTPKKKAAKKQR
ncbi:MAG: ribonuclease R [Gallionellaceae bacterium]|nr:MAG: ribonuclease R [Gallionellaceae bacterium]